MTKNLDAPFALLVIVSVSNDPELVEGRASPASINSAMVRHAHHDKNLDAPPASFVILSLSKP
jgi:hypothetical protein